MTGEENFDEMCDWINHLQSDGEYHARPGITAVGKCEQCGRENCLIEYLYLEHANRENADIVITWCFECSDWRQYEGDEIDNVQMKGFDCG